MEEGIGGGKKGKPAGERKRQEEINRGDVREVLPLRTALPEHMRPWLTEGGQSWTLRWPEVLPALSAVCRVMRRRDRPLI